MSKTIGYRGILADGGQEKIRLRTKTGKTGYRIVKLQIIASTPGVANAELVTKIYRKTAAAVNGTVDFSDNNLLGCAYWQESSSAGAPMSETIIFDRVVFNQDIFVTCFDGSATNATNYYIELETVELSDAQSTQLTLKNLRAVASRFA